MYESWKIYSSRIREFQLPLLRPPTQSPQPKPVFKIMQFWLLKTKPRNNSWPRRLVLRLQHMRTKILDVRHLDKVGPAPCGTLPEASDQARLTKLDTLFCSACGLLHAEHMYSMNTTPVTTGKWITLGLLCLCTGGAVTYRSRRIKTATFSLSDFMQDTVPRHLGKDVCSENEPPWTLGLDSLSTKRELKRWSLANSPYLNVWKADWRNILKDLWGQAV